MTLRATNETIVSGGETLEHAWTRLAATSRIAGMFATQDWHDRWMQHIAHDAFPSVVLSIGEAGHVRGIAPFCRQTYRDLKMSVPAVRFSGREVVSGDYLDWLCEPEDRDAVAADMLHALDAELDAGRMAILGEIVQGSHTDRVLQTWVEERGYKTRIQEARRCPYFELPRDFDEYLGSLKSKFRGAVRRKTRRLLEAVEFVALTDREQVADHLPHLYRLHAMRWQDRGEAGTFSRPGFREFLNDFVRNAPESVEPRLYLLRDKDEYFGALMVFHCHGYTAMHYQGGWNPASEHMKHSPGIVLTARAIASAIEAELQTFDFLRGDEPYKLDFGTSFRHTRTYLIAKRGLRARTYMNVCRVKEWSKRRLKRVAASSK